MTYNINKKNTLYAVHLQTNQVNLSSGNTVPYAISYGTSGHGVTVSSGIMTLPKGEWLVQFKCEAVTTSYLVADIFVDGTQNTNFPQIISRLNPSLTHANSNTNKSNLDTTAIPIRSDGSTTIELRVGSNSNVSEASDCLIYGFKL